MLSRAFRKCINSCSLTFSGRPILPQYRRHSYSCSSPILKNARPPVQQPRAPKAPLLAAAPIAGRRPHCRPRLCRPQLPPAARVTSAHPGYHAPTPSLAAAAAAGRLHRCWPRPLCMPHRRYWPPPPQLSATPAACRCRRCRQPPPLPATAAPAGRRTRPLPTTPLHNLLWLWRRGEALGVSEQSEHPQGCRARDGGGVVTTDKTLSFGVQKTI